MAERPRDPSGRTRIGLVGGGKGGLALLDLLLDWPEGQVVVVIDPEPEAPAMKKARALGLPTASHHLQVFAFAVDLVFEVTGQGAVLDDLLRAKRPGVEVIGAGGLRFFWNLLQDKVSATRQLSVQLDMAVSLGSATEPGQQLAVATQKLAQACGVDRCGFFALDEESGRVEPVTSQFATGEANEAMWVAFTGLRGLTVDAFPFFPELIERRSPIEIEDAATDSLTPPGWTELFEIKSALIVPIFRKDRVAGACVLDYRRERRRFTPDQTTLAMTLAGQVALAYENARLYRRLEERAEKLAALSEVGRLMTSSETGERVFQAIAEAAVTLLGAAHARVWADDPEGRVLSTRGGFGVDPRIEASFTDYPLIPYGQGLAGRIFESRAPEYVVDAQGDPRWLNRRLLTELGLHAFAGVPLVAGDRALGVLAILFAEQRQFTPEDKELMALLADHAALALQNAQLYQRAQQALDELSRAQAQLVRGETLRAVGELAAGAAHHLNNLLAIVLGRIQLALKKFDAPEIQRHLRPAEQAARDGAEVVARLSRFSRGRAEPRLVPLDLNQVVDEVLELTRPRWQAEAEASGVTIEARAEPAAIPEVAADPASLREVLVNLVLNAVDAMPAGGRLTITTSADARGVACAVSDTGVGMSSEIQGRALEPFFTTKGVKSTGLGLSVAYGIVERHGGELRIDSAEGRGTTVTLRLPASSMPADAAVPPAPSTPGALRVLLVDDDAAVREVMSEMLAEEGHRVILATNGAEGLARFRAEAPIDLVLTDLGMPGMTGWDVARAVKAADPSVPVVLLTGWGAEPQGRPEDRAMADFVVAKPVTQEHLRAALAHVLARRTTP